MQFGFFARDPAAHRFKSSEKGATPMVLERKLVEFFDGLFDVETFEGRVFHQCRKLSHVRSIVLKTVGAFSEIVPNEIGRG